MIIILQEIENTSWQKLLNVLINARKIINFFMIVNVGKDARLDLYQMILYAKKIIQEMGQNAK